MTPNSQPILPKTEPDTEPFLIPIRWEPKIVGEEISARIIEWMKLFAECEKVSELDNITLVKRGETHYVKIYDDAFQPCEWCFRLTKDNLHRVAELTEKPLPAALLVLKLP